jgi:hypothetical protein
LRIFKKIKVTKGAYTCPNRAGRNPKGKVNKYVVIHCGTHSKPENYDAEFLLGSGIGN